MNRQVPPQLKTGVNFRRHALRAFVFMGDFVVVFWNKRGFLIDYCWLRLLKNAVFFTSCLNFEFLLIFDMNICSFTTKLAC